MDEEMNLSQNQLEFMKRLKAIGTDLWGTATGAMPEPAEEEERVKEDAAPPVPKKDWDIRNLWKTADETIDWTDALAHSSPTDGLTGKKRWALYHKLAEKVLEGDPAAYTEVLKTVNPLGELTDYAESINMRAPTADRLESTFVCREELMGENRKLYLAAMGLRIARDLLACLPVNEVCVTGEENGNPVFKATYNRRQLFHRNFMFIDPVEFAEECDAEFT